MVECHHNSINLYYPNPFDSPTGFAVDLTPEPVVNRKARRAKASKQRKGPK